MFQISRVDPAEFAFEISHGKHDYSAESFSPPGHAVVMHVIPSKRKTREEHTKTGFYIENL